MDKQQVLINIIQNKYAEISEIERKFGIFGIDGDFRPRIEHYHDAIRAIDNDVADGLHRNSRLSAERLAYDVEMLRQITARPTVAGRGEHHLSTQNEVALNQQLAENINPDAADKRKLTALYRDYTVFFIALLLEKIEDNITARTEENDILVQDCYRLEQALAGLNAGNIDINNVIKSAKMLENDGLRHKIMTMLAKGAPSKDEISSSIATLQNVRRSLAEEKKTLDAAGMRFATSHLMVYEGAKDTVKQLMQSGINIAGKHTESAMQHNQGSKERGF
jgi:hypothetical protein